MAFFSNFADIFYSWESFGVFDIILPFLLIFALVFGILSATRFLGENRPVYVIVSLVIGLMSIRYLGFLSEFMSELFPRLGVGLAVMLSILILVGLFIAQDESRYWGYGLAALGAVIGIIVIYQTFDNLGYFIGGVGGGDTASMIILAVLIIGVIIAVSVSGSNRSTEKDRGKTVYAPWRVEK